MKEKNWNETQTKMLGWLDGFSAEIEQKDIISKVREKSDSEIRDEREVEKKLKLKRYNQVLRVLSLLEMQKSPETEDRIKYLKEKIKNIDNSLSIYRYTHVEQLLEHSEFSSYDLSFWKVKNVDLLQLKQLADVKKKEYMLQNTEFERISALVGVYKI